MGGVGFYYIDNTEKRFQLGHMGQYLDHVIASLHDNPTSMEELTVAYEKVDGYGLFNPGNLPKVPEELTIDTIRFVLGIFKKTDQEVLEYWNKFNGYDKPDYKILATDEKSPIPEIDDDLIDEWKREDPSGEEYATIEDYRRAQAGGNGLVVVDLTSKKFTYLSTYFELNEKDFPMDWTLARL